MNTNSVDVSSLLRQVQAQGQRPGERAVGGSNVRQAALETEVRRPAKAAPPAQDMSAMRKELDATLERIAAKDTRLSFQVDDDSGQTVITVRDAVTSEVLKQIPSEEMLNIARRLEAHLSESADGSGVLLADEA